MKTVYLLIKSDNVSVDRVLEVNNTDRFSDRIFKMYDYSFAQVEIDKSMTNNEVLTYFNKLFTKLENVFIDVYTAQSIVYIFSKTL